jgi:hypothetical protein
LYPGEPRRTRIAEDRAAPRGDRQTLREHAAGAPSLQLICALETALVVCCWRSFSQSNEIGQLSAGDAVDGEAVELDTALSFVIRPGALRVRISSRHPGVSPSGRLP